MDSQQRKKILAAHFAGINPDELTTDFEVFVHGMRQAKRYEQLKQWWEEMDALRVLRHTEQVMKYKSEVNKFLTNPLDLLSQQKDTIIFKDKPIGKTYSYYRTVLPQEIQIRVAYDTLIERFMTFLQHEKCAIRLSENQLTVTLFIPKINFQLENEWQQFIQFAYSEEELYKSFTLFVNSMKLTNRGFGYVHFPSVTEAMKLWQAAFYIATLKERVIRYPDNYRKAKTDEERESAFKSNREELKQLLDGLRTELRTNELNFDKAVRLSRRFNRTGSSQFSYGTVKPRSKKGKIEDKIIEILEEPVSHLNCPLALVDEIAQNHIHVAGDTIKNRCYSCGRHLPPKSETCYFKGKLEANRFVFSDPSQRLQSGSGQAQPSICLNCLVVAFGCPIKLAGGAIIVRLVPQTDEENQQILPEKYLQMLTLGELNLIAGRYLLINCREFVRERGGATPVSEKIGQVQYTLWRVARTLPSGTLEKMDLTLFAGESEIPLPTRHLVWLSYLQDSFSPRLIVNGKDNMRLCQAIRLIQKDEVIAAIYTLATAESTEVTPIYDWSYSEKRSLEELREKYCTLLERSSKGDKIMAKQAAFSYDVAALTGLTYAYCDYVRRVLEKSEPRDTVQREVKKLIEKVVNASFFNYEAADVLPRTRATMFRNDDNYFCYDRAKQLLKETLKLELSGREGQNEKGQEQLAVYFDDILNAYAELSQKYNKTEQRKLFYQLKLNLHAKFAPLFNQKGD
ncbi:hypothetical protein C6502_07570 [Candidatus Poribacteria bacterium]|nr:MAG: hypothetical protein C6502_07570 [Candidatus Poribacteria bacterium]